MSKPVLSDSLTTSEVMSEGNSSGNGNNKHLCEDLLKGGINEAIKANRR